MKKVLICDDALVMRMVIKKEIEKLGFEVVAEASDGEEAVELYKADLSIYISEFLSKQIYILYS